MSEVDYLSDGLPAVVVDFLVLVVGGVVLVYMRNRHVVHISEVYVVFRNHKRNCFSTDYSLSVGPGYELLSYIATFVKVYGVHALKVQVMGDLVLSTFS